MIKGEERMGLSFATFIGLDNEFDECDFESGDFQIILREYGDLGFTLLAINGLVWPTAPGQKEFFDCDYWEADEHDYDVAEAISKLILAEGIPGLDKLKEYKFHSQTVELNIEELNKIGAEVMAS